MDVTQKIIRVYEIPDFYKESFESFFKRLFNKSFTLNNYLNDDGNIELAFNTSTESIFELERIKKDLSRIALIDGAKNLKKSLLDVYINEKHPKVNVDSFYFTLIHEKTIKIDKEKLMGHEFSFISFQEIEKINKNLLNKITDAFDLIILYISSFTNLNYFENIIINDSVFLNCKNEYIWDINLNTSLKSSAIALNPIDIKKFEQNINFLNNQKFRLYEWITPIPSLINNAIIEENKWLKYYLLYSALELLIQKSFKKDFEILYEKLEINLKNKIVDEEYYELINKKKKKYNKKDKFVFLATYYYPYEYEEDINIFKDLKKYRDAMAHGKSVNEEELPFIRIKSLLNKYLNKIISFDKLGMTLLK